MTKSSAVRQGPAGRVLTVAGAVIVAVFVLMCLASLVWTPYDPTAISPAERFAAPSLAHLLGTDHFGRDTLSRIMRATQPALLIGVGSVLLGAVVGVLLGAVAAGLRLVRPVLMRLVDALMAFPGILLAMMFIMALGRGLVGTFIAVAIFMVPTFARLTCNLVLELRRRPFITAARSYGSSRWRLFWRQILPNVLPRLVTQLSSCVGRALLLEAALSFLGLGVQPPAPSWGVMVSDALTYIYTYPGQILAPGLALMIAVLGFNLLGDGLNDALVKRGA